jgi:hypothetical protein
MLSRYGWNYWGIHNPVLRFLAKGFTLFVVIVLISLGLFALTVAFGTMFFMIVLSFPFHLILRACGRRGFYVREGNTHHWKFTGALDSSI